MHTRNIYFDQYIYSYNATLLLSIDVTANTIAATSADTTTCVVTIVADETASLASKGDSQIIDWLGWGGLGLENPYWQYGLFMIMDSLNRFTTKVFQAAGDDQTSG